nr:integrase, catalytic region, zinc finger, CCHC-type, peptidase aspartic, catalytic [Tanacetum cinerariifolium]
MNYLEEQTNGEAMINSIKNGDQPLPRVTQVSIAGTSSTEQPPLKDKFMYNKTAKGLWNALARHMIGFEYGEQDRKATVLYEYETFKANEGELLLETYIRYLQVINDLKKCGYSKDNCELNFKFLNNLQPEWKQYATMMRQFKNLMDINIDALYNIIKQNQGDVNDAMGLKKKNTTVTSDLLALIVEKTKVSKSKEKVVVSSDSEGSDADDFSKLKKITALLAKAFNRRNFYSKPTNNNLRTSSTSQSANKKQEFVKSDDKKVEKKADENKRDMSRVKCYNYQAWMESSSDLDQEINANMVYMAQIEKVLSDSEATSSSADEKIFEVSYYLSESKSEFEFETSEYYDNSTNYGLFVNNDDDQEIFHDAIKSASENFIENHIDYQKDYDKSDVDHNDSEEKDHLLDKLIRKFNKKIVKCQKRIEKANQQKLNEQLKVLIEKNDDLLAQTNVLKDQLQVKHVVFDTHVECQKKYAKFEAERYEYMIRYSAYFDNDNQHRKQIADQEVLYDKMSVQLVELDEHVRDLKNIVLEKDFKNFELEECVRNKDLEIKKCLEHLNVCKNKLHKMGRTNQTVHMIMPSKDNLYNGRKGIGFENPNYFEKAKDLRPTLYDEKVIGLGYTPMFLTHSNEALEIKKFKRSRDNKIEFAYDYENLNASYVNEKINFEDDYFQEIINLDFEKIDSPFQQTSSLKPYVPNVILEKIIIDLKDEVVNLLEKEKVNLETIESLKSKGFESSETVISESENQSENDCLVVEKEYEKVENSKVIAPRMFKLSVSQCVSPISMSKTSCESNNVEIKLKIKRHLDTFSSVRRPSHNGVVWKKKGSSNTSNVDLSFVGHSKLNKNVKRYSRKDLLACNNSHLGETSSASVCNDAMNVSCNPRLCVVFDDNNFFIFDDVNVRIYPVSKMPVRKKPRDSMNVRSKSNMIKSLPRTVHKCLPKMKPLAEPVAKWIPRIVQICLGIIDLGCSKHMTGNRALLTNFVEKFLETVSFGNNDFTVIAGYGDVVIGSMTIKKVYYVECLGHNLFSVGQFCDKGLEVAFRKSTCFDRNEDGVDLLTGDRSSNLLTCS